MELSGFCADCDHYFRPISGEVLPQRLCLDRAIRKRFRARSPLLGSLALTIAEIFPNDGPTGSSSQASACGVRSPRPSRCPDSDVCVSCHFGVERVFEKNIYLISEHRLGFTYGADGQLQDRLGLDANGSHAPGLEALLDMDDNPVAV